MTKRINVFLLAFVFYLPASAAPPRLVKFDSPAIQRVQNDTIGIQRRSFDQPSIDEFKSDPTYQYGRPREGLSLWQRILLWILMVLAKLLQLATQTTLGQIIFYGLCAWLILYVVLRLLNLEMRDLFFKTSASSRINFKIAEENIHGLDFEKLIEDAIQRRQFRDAVRLVFLSSLKKLSEARLIQWTPGKTNDDYLAELTGHAVSPRLQELRYYFDYAWYGHFEIDDQTFARVQQIFKQFNDNLA